MPLLRWLTGGSDGVGEVMRASVTPLASIFGSGFLIIVPVLERTVGSLAVVAITGVCIFAWLVGAAIRHNVATVEAMAADDTLDHGTRSLEKWSDRVIVVAYVISVGLYVRIMAEYMVSFSGSDSELIQRVIACAAIALIVAIGLARGFDGLDRLDRLALAAVLTLVTVLGATFVLSDAGDLLGSGLDLPPVPGGGLIEMLLILGGILITVQGFETVRYLGEEFDRETRVRACRFSQLVATPIYIGFTAAATPLMGLGSGSGVDSDLLDITARVAPLLSLPLVGAAVLSQFSAATADTVAASGNLHTLYPRAAGGRRAYAVSGGVAIALAATVPTFTIIAVASRAFAAYYCLQCLIAVRTCDSVARRGGYAALAIVLLAITLLAEPAR